MIITRPLAIILSLIGLSQTSLAELRLPQIFSDHAVLQREISVPIWGWDHPGAKVTVNFSGQQKTTTVNQEGKWSLSLDPLTANKTPSSLTISSSTGDKKVFQDILVGEVWLASGQSNMQWTISRSRKEDQAVATAKTYPNLRIANIPRAVNYQPQSDVKVSWQISTAEVAKSSSAVAWFFGQNLHQQLDIPVGIITSSWGGSKIEPWTPREAYRDTPELENLYRQRNAQTPGTAAHLEAQRKHLEKVKQWTTRAESNLAAGKPSPSLPSAPATMPTGHKTIGTYEAMIHPLIPYALRGFIWYQGESNNGEGMLYASKMTALIESWRTLWKLPDAPFIYTQLAPFNYRKNKPSDLAEIWQAQLKTLRHPHTGMAVTNDIGNLKDIHPTNKSTVGKRLALWALANSYGQTSLSYSGPLYKSLSISKGKAIIYFDHAEGLKTRDGSPPNHFEIASANNKWFPADVQIKGSTLIATSNKVRMPTQIRYAWNHLAQPNLTNAAGLPASAFHSHWPQKN